MANVYKIIDPQSEASLIMRKQHEDAVHAVDMQRAQSAQSMDDLASQVFQAVEEYIEKRLADAHVKFLKHTHADDPRTDKLLDICTSLERRLAIAEDRAQRSDDALNRITELMVRR
jgi:hypothetical protein